MATKTVALVYRLETEAAVSTAAEVAQWLKSQGHRALTAPEQTAVKSAPLMKSAKEFDDVDLVVVFGGDGTYLRAVRALEGRQIPVMGFNMGSLGFLTVHPAKKAQTLIAKALAGKMTLGSRSMIHVTIRRKGKARGEFHALNDVVLERGSSPHLINAGIYLGDHLVSEVKADGFIVSSPTGSTAYSLAAGGPILDPSVKAFSITPVAPHALTTRPLIVPDDTAITFKLVPGRDQKANFVVDGQKEMELGNEDEVLLQRSSYDHLVVREPGFNAYTVLKEKLKFGDRA